MSQHDEEASCVALQEGVCSVWNALGQARQELAAMRALLESWPLGKSMLPVNMSGAGKAAAEVIKAAREAYHVLMDMEASPDPWDVIGEAADILDCALLKFRNPADSQPTGSTESNANTKEEGA